jgi:rfaE bifunctional protein nucleotidyltransferase chain/domain
MKTTLESIKAKIFSLSDFLNLRSALKKQGKKVVFTNGCFDILHLGHVSYLAQAADLGDFLVVALNDDASVRAQNKGENRPINPENARALLLASLSFVDAVILFGEQTPLRIIREIQPDVLVKGADYDVGEKDEHSKKYIVGSKEVLANGGEVKTIDLVPNYSTSSIFSKLEKQDSIEK